MKPVQTALGVALALALAAQPAPILAAAKSAGAKPVAAAKGPAVDPAAVAALRRMSAYLTTLASFEIKAETSMEVVVEDGQKFQVDSVNHYLVRRPDGFLIEMTGDQKSRQFFYNGKQLTINAPKLGYYATVPAPPTILATLNAAADKYGVELPLQDLFLWSDPSVKTGENLRSATVVGTATIDGVACDQYAFRSEAVDWQIWIAKGDKPVPKKVVIVDRVDPARPAFIARLDWNTSPQISEAAFTFKPGSDSHHISIASK